MKQIIAIAMLALMAFAPQAEARNTRHELPLQELLNSPMAREAGIDGSVRFYLRGAAHPPIQSRMGDDIGNRKTNAANKSDVEACNWVALTVLKAFQEKAKAMGANAVVDMVSFYKRREFSSPTNYECYAGTILAGVTLKGTYAKVGN